MMKVLISAIMLSFCAVSFAKCPDIKVICVNYDKSKQTFKKLGHVCTPSWYHGAVPECKIRAGGESLKNKCSTKYPSTNLVTYFIGVDWLSINNWVGNTGYQKQYPSSPNIRPDERFYQDLGACS